MLELQRLAADMGATMQVSGSASSHMSAITRVASAVVSGGAMRCRTMVDLLQLENSQSRTA